MKRLLISYGTRPEWIKIKPLYSLLKDKIPVKLLFTGQHSNIHSFQYDLKLDNILQDCDRLNGIFSNILSQANILDDFDVVLVQGDTASAAALALAAFNKQKKILHLEAGLRTHNLAEPYPEEAYRQIISRLADVHFCPTKQNRSNLKKEKTGGKIYVTGNTGLDDLSDVGTEYGNKVLITLHRRENAALFKDWFYQLSLVALRHPELEFIFPAHPNPAVQEHIKLLEGIHVIKPVEHEQLVSILAQCKLVISDSGGLQEECAFLNKRIIVCRGVTERQEGVKSGHSVLCPTPSEFPRLFEMVNRHYWIDAPCPFGNGKASKKVAKIIVDFLSNQT